MENIRQNKNNYKLILKIILLSIMITLFRALLFSIEPDYFWHYKLGEQIIAQKEVFTEEIFSWVSKEYETMQFSHSWLGSVIVYLFGNFFMTDKYPYLGMYIYENIFYFLTILTIFIGLRKELVKCKPYDLTTLLIITVPVVITVGWNARPQMFSNILFVLALLIFYKWDKGNQKIIWWLPVISLLWANIHGGTVFLLIAFCVAYTVCSFINFNAGQICSERKSIKESKSLIKVTIASIITALINPYGSMIFTYGFNPVVKEEVNEWAAPAVLSSPGLCVALLVVILVILYNKKLSLYSLIPIVSMILFNIIYARGQNYVGLAFPFFIVEYMQTDTTKDTPGRMYRTMEAFVLVLICALSIMTAVKSFDTKMENIKNTHHIISDQIIETLKEKDYERLYNDYDAGGYLIYKEIPVFIDSRADPYPEELLRDGKFFPTWTDMFEPKEIIKKYEFDGFLINKRHQIYKYFKNNADYTEVISDGNYTLFEPSI